MQREKFGVLVIVVQKLYATKKLTRAMMSKKAYQSKTNLVYHKMC